MMRPRTYSILARAVEEGVRMGVHRAHKHVEHPSQEHIEDETATAVLGAICEVFDFDDDVEPEAKTPRDSDAGADALREALRVARDELRDQECIECGSAWTECACPNGQWWRDGAALVGEGGAP